jgi:hypothetical protein
MKSGGIIDPAATDSNTIRWGRHAIPQGLVAPPDVIALALRQSMPLQTMLTRRAVLGKSPFLEEKEHVPDVDLQLRLVRREPPLKVFYCPERLVEYRIHLGQVSTRKSVKERVDSHRAYLSSLESLGQVPAKHLGLYRRKVAIQRAALASCYASNRDWRSWWNTSLAVIRDDPLWLWSYASLLRPLMPAAMAEPLRLIRRMRSRLLTRRLRMFVLNRAPDISD